MCIDSTKAKGIGRRPPRLAPRLHPRPRIGGNREGRVHQPDTVMDLVAQHRWQDLVAQRKGHLDDRRRPRRRYAMAYHRLDRSDRHMRQMAVARTKDRAQGLDLGAIAQGDAGAMRLDQPDRGRVQAGIGISPAHGQNLALQTRRHQP